METKETKKTETTKPETTKEAKERIRRELAELVAKEKRELAERRAVGVVGFYGRVPSVVDGLRDFAERNPYPVASFTVDSIAEIAEKKFVASNPDRKKSANSSRLYTGEVLEAFRLVGLVGYTSVDEKFILAPALRGLLSGKTVVVSTGAESLPSAKPGEGRVPRK